MEENHGNIFEWWRKKNAVNILEQGRIHKGVDPGGGGGGEHPQWKYLGGGVANISFCPPPPNNFDNLKNS